MPGPANLKLAPLRGRLHAHKMVAGLAYKMAESVFDEAMSRDNELYNGAKRAHPGKNAEELKNIFCREMAPRFLKSARSTLAGMLAGRYPESLKEQIHDALVKDNSLRRGR